MTLKVGRNDLCPCQSGKKYKQCCMQKEKPATQRRFKATVLSHKVSAATQGTGGEGKAISQLRPDLIERNFAPILQKTPTESSEAKAATTEAPIEPAH